jgi:4-amino-4-deoxy-L-arabinose transferase-like glycosyltransferase
MLMETPPPSSPKLDPPLVRPATTAEPSRGVVLLLWFLSAIPLLAFLGSSPVQRTQEARVLETARQMLGGLARAWLLPKLNGEYRIRKPPLAYWMAATSFSAFGVSEWTGRLPTAIVSWLTVGVTYAIAARQFGRRAGVVASATLLGSYLFFRFGRLAETDAPAALFVALGIHWFWRIIDHEDDRAPAWHHHAAAATTALAFMSKGPPGLFPLIFFVALAGLRRRWRVLWDFGRCGAPITLILLAGWWFAYAAWALGPAQFQRELEEVTEGIDHKAWFWEYLPLLIAAVMPWIILVIGAIVAAIPRRRDRRISATFVWALAIFVPLCIPWNKQIHYLLPLVPSLFVLVGWLVAEATMPSADAKLQAAVRKVFVATAILSIAVALAAPVFAVIQLGKTHEIPPTLWLAAIACVVIGLFCTIGYRRRPIVATVALAGTWTFAFSLVFGPCSVIAGGVDIRDTAASIQTAAGRGPYVFYGGDTSLPLCFALRREIHRVNTPEELRAAAAQSPGLVVILEVPENHPEPAPPPAEFKPLGPDVGAKGQRFRLYALNPQPG